jgi:hypothetical protein
MELKEAVKQFARQFVSISKGGTQKEREGEIQFPRVRITARIHEYV